MNMRKKSRLTTSRRFMRRVFARLVRDVYPARTKLVSVTAQEVGAYRFKHALRYRIVLTAPQGRRITVVIRGNIPSEDTKKEALVADRVQRTLARRGFAYGVLRVPITFGLMPSLGLHLYEEFPGVTLEKLIISRDPKSRRLAKQAGIWLAALHKKKLRIGPLRTAAQIERDAGFFRDDAVRYAPELSERMTRVVGYAAQAQAHLASTYRHTFCITHGDMHLGNIVAGTDGSVGFIDFGNSVQYDPLSDVGNLLAQLDSASWGDPRRMRSAQTLSRMVLAAYHAHAGFLGTRTSMRIDLHRAWWLLQILAYKLSTDLPFGRRIADNVFKNAERLLARHGFPVPPALENTGRGGLRTALLAQPVMHGFFQRHLQKFFPDSQKVERVEIAQPHALATSSYLTRYRLALMRPDGSVKRTSVRGNFVSASTYGIMERIYAHSHRAFNSMRPLWYEPNYAYELYEEVRGVSLRNIPIRSSEFNAMIPRIARALAGLHGVPPRRIRALSFAHEHATVLSNTKRASQGLPRHRSFVARAATAIVKGERALWNASRAIVHNDFQASNIIVDRGTVGIIDYTMSGAGNAGMDVGNFIAHLTVMLYGKVGRKRTEVLRNRFVREYARGLPARRRKAIAHSIPLFELRSSLDILAITLVNLGTKDPNGRRYIRLLLDRMGALMTALP